MTTEEVGGTVRLAALADQLMEARARIETLEADLAAAKQVEKRLEEETIPSLMDELELGEVTTSTGLTIRVANKMNTKQLTERHGAALQWLRDNGEAGVIKTAVSVPFGAGALADAEQLIERLAGEGFIATKSVVVHPQTLGALLTRKLEDGVDVPLDTFGAYQRRVAKVEVRK